MSSYIGKKAGKNKKHNRHRKSDNVDSSFLDVRFIKEVYDIINNQDTNKVTQYFNSLETFGYTVDCIGKEMERIIDIAEKFCAFLIDSQNYIRAQQHKWKNFRKEVDTKEILSREMLFTISDKIEYI